MIHGENFHILMRKKKRKEKSKLQRVFLSTNPLHVCVLNYMVSRGRVKACSNAEINCCLFVLIVKEVIENIPSSCSPLCSELHGVEGQGE